MTVYQIRKETETSYRVRVELVTTITDYQEARVTVVLLNMDAPRDVQYYIVEKEISLCKQSRKHCYMKHCTPQL